MILHLACISMALGAFAIAPTDLNVLHLVVDDLQISLNEAYGQSEVKTPNMDRLAASGLVFNRAMSQLSVCAPSRNSFMTGRRPDSIAVWSFTTDFRKQCAQRIFSMPEYFKENGFEFVLGTGKTYHEGLPANYDEPYSWTNQTTYYPYEHGACKHGGQGGGMCVYPDTEQNKIYDYRLGGVAVQRLQMIANAREAKLAAGESPGRFWLGVGFKKPHAPFESTESIWSSYDPSSLTPATLPTFPTNAPPVAGIVDFSVVDRNGTRHAWNLTHPVPTDAQQRQRQAYFASITFMDQQIGVVLDQLEALGLDNSTIVVLHADHGYSLGNGGEWEKKSLFELVARVPLIVRVPGKEKAMGKKTMAPFELVDLLPTLAELTGLPSPGLDGQGISQASLFEDPSPRDFPKSHAITQYPRCGDIAKGADNCNQVEPTKFEAMGYSLRTPDWRFTIWWHWDTTNLVPLWDQSPIAMELYDHRQDNGSITNMDFVNLAYNQSFASTVTSLNHTLRSIVIPSGGGVPTRC